MNRGRCTPRVEGRRSGARAKWQAESNCEFTLRGTVLMMVCRVVTTRVSTRRLNSWPTVGGGVHYGRPEGFQLSFL
jgi:hypothetical protein